MAIYKKILGFSPIVLFLIMILGCGKKIDNSPEPFDATKFPRDEQGYPKSNIVIINGKEFTINNLLDSKRSDDLDYTIRLSDVKRGDCIEVILPQYLPINLWGIEEREDIDLINYDKKELPVQQDVEGKSSFIQKFSFTMNDTSVMFKWYNVRECGKSFIDKRKDYLLQIKI